MKIALAALTRATVAYKKTRPYANKVTPHLTTTKPPYKLS